MNSFLHTDFFLLSVLAVNVIIVILFIINWLKLSKLRKNYSYFMSKLGKGDNIDEMLKKYIEEVDCIKIENKEIEKYCEKLENRVNKCTQKIGLIRYNAFKDTGSNLSFAVAILNEEDDGIVLNGIYSRDTSNIYCKTVEKGSSSYVLSKEEKEAIKIAVKNEKTHNSVED